MHVGGPALTSTVGDVTKVATGTAEPEYPHRRYLLERMAALLRARIRREQERLAQYKRLWP